MQTIESVQMSLTRDKKYFYLYESLSEITFETILEELTPENVDECTEKISQALATDAKETLSIIVQILSCDHIQCTNRFDSENVKIRCCSVINYYFVSNEDKINPEFSFLFLSEVLRSPQISLKNKEILERAIYSVIMSCVEVQDISEISKIPDPFDPSNFYEQSETFWKWEKFIEELLMSENNYYQKEYFTIGLMLLKIFVRIDMDELKESYANSLSSLDIKLFKRCMKMAIENYPQISIENCKLVGDIFETWNTFLENVHYFNSEKLYNFLSELEECSEMFEALSLAYNKQTEPKKQNYFIEEEKNSESRDQVQNKEHRPTLLFLDFEDVGFREIADMQLKALKFHHSLFICPQKISLQSNIFRMTGDFLEYMINTLFFVALKPNCIYDNEIDDNIIKILEIVQIICLNSDEVLQVSWREIIHYILFPFLSTSDSEIEDFESNSTSWIELNEECCEKQIMNELKVKSAKFLEKICDKSQNFAEDIELNLNGKLVMLYIFKFILHRLEKILEIESFEEDELLTTRPKQINLNDLTLETCFMVLSINSYSLERYPEECKRLNRILKCEKLKYLSDLERAKIYMFLAYNYELALRNEKEEERKWIHQAFFESNHQTVIDCAMDFVNNTMTKVYDDSYMKIIISRIENNLSTNFWLMIRKMLTLFLNQIQKETLIMLINQIFKRIEREINIVLTQSFTISHVILCLLELLLIICENHQFMSENPEICQLLWKSTELFKVSLENNFTDTLIKIINTYIFRNCSENFISEHISIFFQELLKYFDESDYLCPEILITFNEISLKSNYNSFVKDIFKMLKNGLFYHLEQHVESFSQSKKQYIGNLLIVLQNLISIHGSEINVSELEDISFELENFYPKKSKKQKPYQGKKLRCCDENLLAKAINLQLILSDFIGNTNIFDVLKKYHNMEIYSLYDLRVLILFFKEKKFADKGYLENSRESLHLGDLMLVLINLVYDDYKIFLSMKNKMNKIISLRNEQSQSMKTNSQCYQKNISSISNLEEDEFNSSHPSANEEKIKKFKYITLNMTIFKFIHSPFIEEEKRHFVSQQSYRHRKKDSEKFVSFYISENIDNRSLFFSLLSNLKQRDFEAFSSVLNGFSASTKNKLDQIVSGKINSYLEEEEMIAIPENTSIEEISDMMNFTGLSESIYSSKKKSKVEKSRKIYKVLKIKKGQLEEAEQEEVEFIYKRNPNKHDSEDVGNFTNSENSSDESEWAKCYKLHAKGKKKGINI